MGSIRQNLQQTFEGSVAALGRGDGTAWTSSVAVLVAFQGFEPRYAAPEAAVLTIEREGNNSTGLSSTCIAMEKRWPL